MFTLVITFTDFSLIFKLSRWRILFSVNVNTVVLFANSTAMRRYWDSGYGGDCPMICQPQFPLFGLLLLIRRRRRRRRKYRIWWMHPVTFSRTIYGQYYTIMKDLREDNIKFFNYFRWEYYCKFILKCYTSWYIPITVNRKRVFNQLLGLCQ